MIGVTSDFPTWFRAGCYGGLGCSLIAAAGVAAYALARRRGTPRQLAGAMLGCLAAAVCILPAIIWSQTRLDLQGPALGTPEVLLWLSWVAVIGWMLPLSVSAGFLMLAAPFDARARQRLSGPGKKGDEPRPSDEERQHEPLGPGVAWGRLVYLDGPYANRQVPLSRQIILVGRERDNDILLETDLASRYHAELHLEHGRAYLKDCGSMNGTSVNGQKVWSLVPLQGGDVLEIGGQRFRYEDLLPQASDAKASSGHQPNQDPQSGETTALPSLAAQPAQPTAFTGRLIVTGGPNAGSIFEMKEAAITIGRSSGCQVVIPDASISRRHAQIVRQESGFYAQDLGSRNGTAINGQRLSEPRRLEDGDTLTVGNIPLRYVAGNPAPATAEREAAIPAPAAAGKPDTSEKDLGHEPTATPPRGREKHRPLRLPSRKLEQAPAAPAPVPETAGHTSIQVSNNILRPQRLVKNRAFLAPPEPPPAPQS